MIYAPAAVARNTGNVVARIENILWAYTYQVGYIPVTELTAGPQKLSSEYPTQTKTAPEGAVFN